MLRSESVNVLLLYVFASGVPALERLTDIATMNERTTGLTSAGKNSADFILDRDDIARAHGERIHEARLLRTTRIALFNPRSRSAVLRPRTRVFSVQL